MDRCYLCIDLKSFYASVECVERGLDPMTTNLVVADPSRTEKTICLAVSPSMKALGVRNRCRVFEIPKGIDYIMAPPRMQKYIDYAAQIYGIYIGYISPEDIHVYSIDEAFLDVTGYLKRYGKTPKEMALFLMNEVARRVGVRATCGIGTNLYLAKIALDITAKHADDFIGILNEESYRETLWDHEPLTDFWRVGKGTAARLERFGIRTMRGIAQADEEDLYREFGVDAELLIDHAWGREPVTMRDIHTYRPRTSSISSGQVLFRDYTFDEARLILREMLDAMCLELVEKGMETPSVTLTVGYSNGLDLPMARGTAKLSRCTNADRIIIPETVAVYDRVVDPDTPVRRIYLSCNNLTEETGIRQMSFLEDSADDEMLKKNRKVQETMLQLKEKFGKNAVFRAMDLREEATARQRNMQIGGHRSGEDDEA